MEIVHVTGRYPPHLGGVEVVVQELARRQAEAGHSVTVYCADCPEVGPPGAVGLHTEDGVVVCRLPARTVGHTPLIPSLAAHLNRHRPGADVVHVHGTHAGISESVTASCRRAGVPYVTHVHLLVRPSGPAGRVLLPLYRHLLYGRHLRRAARVICLTRTMADAIVAQYGIDPDAVVVVPNGGPEPGPEPGLEERPAATELLFVGRLTAQKNVLAAVEAMALLPGAHLRVIGDGDQAGAVRDTVRRLGLGNVTLEGRLAPEAVHSAYQRADALVMPSSHEGLPLVLLEALAAGLPILAAPLPEVLEVAGGAVLPLDDTTPAGVAAGARRLLGSPPLRRELALRGRDVARRHSWGTALAAVQDVYDSVRAPVPA